MFSCFYIFNAGESGISTGKNELKRLITLTKETDSAYLEKRNIPETMPRPVHMISPSGRTALTMISDQYTSTFMKTCCTRTRSKNLQLLYRPSKKSAHCLPILENKPLKTFNEAALGLSPMRPRAI